MLYFPLTPYKYIKAAFYFFRDTWTISMILSTTLGSESYGYQVSMIHAMKKLHSQ